MSPVPAAAYDEQTTLNELVFALGGRDEPTVALVECASLAKRRELEAELARRMPEYQFYPLDVTPYTVTSLLGTLNEHLPAAIRESQPVSWVVNVHGLENSRLLGQDGQLTSPLTAQLNLERELLFRRVPYLIVLWGDADFFRTLQREAPDFWHWVTYRFRFEDHTARPVAALPPLPPERLPGPGNVAERQARITELRERYDHLALDDSDKKRLLKDKIDILSLLGAEYREAFIYPEAADAYRMAIALQERLRGDNNAQAALWLGLGSVYELQKYLPAALTAYKKCQALTSDANIAIVFHQLGQVYRTQKNWVLALENYQQALEWEQRSNNESQTGRTYHSIGMLYEKQGQWALALDNYSKALEWQQRSGDNSRLGNTYHQIGITYQRQGQWVRARESYEQALEWQKRVGNEFGMGGTYFQLGHLYAEKTLYTEAFFWLTKAMASFTKYGDPFLPHAKELLAHTIRLQQAGKNSVPTAGIKPKRKRK